MTAYDWEDIEVPEILKGDYPGHPFRGNQHVSAKGGSRGKKPKPKGKPRSYKRGKGRAKVKRPNRDAVARRQAAREAIRREAIRDRAGSKYRQQELPLSSAKQAARDVIQREAAKRIDPKPGQTKRKKTGRPRPKAKPRKSRR